MPVPHDDHRFAAGLALISLAPAGVAPGVEAQGRISVVLDMRVVPALLLRCGWERCHTRPAHPLHP